jgi:hypothetical protein
MPPQNIDRHLRPPSKAPSRIASRWRGAAPGGRGVGHAEASLRLFGLVLAMGAAAFASHMILDTDRRPQFAGLEHLSIFSKPTRFAARRMEKDGQIAAVRGPGIDYTPVGVVSRSNIERSSSGFVVVEATPDFAILQTPRGGRVRVSRGDALEGLGRVYAIERRGGQWVVVTSNGVIGDKQAKVDVGRGKDGGKGRGE